MKFPKNLMISILSQDNKPILQSDIMIVINLIAPRKNNYHLGPFFTNNKGVVFLTEKDLQISAQAEAETGLMDYLPYVECSDEVEIEIFNYENLDKLIYGRTIWGLVGDETSLYETKENLLERIKSSANHKVLPNKAYARFIGQKEIEVKISTAEK